MAAVEAQGEAPASLFNQYASDSQTGMTIDEYLAWAQTYRPNINESVWTDYFNRLVGRSRLKLSIADCWWSFSWTSFDANADGKIQLHEVHAAVNGECPAGSKPVGDSTTDACAVLVLYHPLLRRAIFFKISEGAEQSEWVWK
jgi:hypothetical protein